MSARSKRLLEMALGIETDSTYKYTKTQSINFNSNGNNDLKRLSNRDEESFQFSLNLIKPHITKKDTVMRQSISPEERLLVT
nr:unnamed protein product [Callosobruchus analis]